MIHNDWLSPIHTETSAAHPRSPILSARMSVRQGVQPLQPFTRVSASHQAHTNCEISRWFVRFPALRIEENSNLSPASPEGADR